MYSCATSLTDDITMFPVLICEGQKKNLKIPKGSSEKNKNITVTKRKRTNNDLQNTIHIDQCEPH